MSKRINTSVISFQNLIDPSTPTTQQRQQQPLIDQTNQSDESEDQILSTFDALFRDNPLSPEIMLMVISFLRIPELFVMKGVDRDSYFFSREILEKNHFFASPPPQPLPSSLPPPPPSSLLHSHEYSEPQIPKYVECDRFSLYYTSERIKDDDFFNQHNMLKILKYFWLPDEFFGGQWNSGRKPTAVKLVELAYDHDHLDIICWFKSLGLVSEKQEESRISDLVSWILPLDIAKRFLTNYFNADDRQRFWTLQTSLDCAFFRRFDILRHVAQNLPQSIQIFDCGMKIDEISKELLRMTDDELNEYYDAMGSHFRMISPNSNILRELLCLYHKPNRETNYLTEARSDLIRFFAAKLSQQQEINSVLNFVVAKCDVFLLTILLEFKQIKLSQDLIDRMKHTDIFVIYFVDFLEKNPNFKPSDLFHPNTNLEKLEEYCHKICEIDCEFEINF